MPVPDGPPRSGASAPTFGSASAASMRSSHSGTNGPQRASIIASHSVSEPRTASASAVSGATGTRPAVRPRASSPRSTAAQPAASRSTKISPTRGVASYNASMQATARPGSPWQRTRTLTAEAGACACAGCAISRPAARYACSHMRFLEHARVACRGDAPAARECRRRRSRWPSFARLSARSSTPIHPVARRPLRATSRSRCTAHAPAMYGRCASSARSNPGLSTGS